MVTPRGKVGCLRRRKLSSTSRPPMTLESTHLTQPMCIHMECVSISVVSYSQLLMIILGVREDSGESHQAIQLAP